MVRLDAAAGSGQSGHLARISAGPPRARDEPDTVPPLVLAVTARHLRVPRISPAMLPSSRLNRSRMKSSGASPRFRTVRVSRQANNHNHPWKTVNRSSPVIGCVNTWDNPGWFGRQRIRGPADQYRSQRLKHTTDPLPGEVVDSRSGLQPQRSIWQLAHLAEGFAVAQRISPAQPRSQ